jgi:hypothetical protein
MGEARRRREQARVAVESRECGECTACCVALPVRELDLPPYHACAHLRAAPNAGCGIYPDRPSICRAWFCTWRLSPALDDELRPDRSGVIFDPVPDTARYDDGNEMPVCNAWAMPGHADAFETDPKIKHFVRWLLFDRRVGVVWRTPPEPNGVRHYRMLYPHNGQMIVGRPVPETQDFSSETEQNRRIGRAHDLWRAAR